MINPDNAPLSVYTGVPGWESVAEQGLLILLATIPPHGVIVEIGSQFGMSASLFRLASPDSFVCCIEIDPDAPYVDNLKEAKLYSEYVVRPILADSSQFNWLEWAKHNLGTIQTIDLLFIDGDHSYGGALADLQNFTPHIQPTGFVAVHDCACNTNKAPHPSHHDVYNAVQAWLQTDGHKNGFRFMFSVDSTMVFRRMNSGNS